MGIEQRQGNRKEMQGRFRIDLAFGLSGSLHPFRAITRMRLVPTPCYRNRIDWGYLARGLCQPPKG